MPVNKRKMEALWREPQGYWEKVLRAQTRVSMRELQAEVLAAEEEMRLRLRKKAQTLESER